MKTRLEDTERLPASGHVASSEGSAYQSWLTALWRRHFHKGRGGRAKLALTSSLGSRVLLASVNLLTMPITVRYLGNEGYGLMVVISSVVSWLQFSTLGIGLALQNPLTDARAARDSKRQAELLSTALLSLLAIASLLLVAGMFAFPIVNWLSVFPPTTDRFVNQIPIALAIVYVALLGSIVLSVIGPVYAARQELHLSNIPTLAAGAGSLGATLLAVRMDLGLAGIVLASVGTNLLAQFCFAIWTLYLRGIPELRPRVMHWSAGAWSELFGRGRSFLLLQLFTIVFFQADAFIIAQFLTTDTVTPYSVAQKVFLQVGGLFGLVSGSMWSAYGDAKSRRDFPWIRRSRRAIEKLFFVFYVVLALGMTFFGHSVLAWWVGEAAAPSTLLIAAVSCYFFIREWTTVNAILLNGLDVIEPQVWVLGISALLILTLNLLLVRPLGVIALPLGGAIGLSAISAWYLPMLAERSIRRMETEWHRPATETGSSR